MVTVSPDVASSTNLGGWINRVGMWHMDEHRDWFEDDRSTLLHWAQSQKGQHIELGIAEVNLVGLLSELGLTWSRDGQPLLPIGTLYDPFVTRALEPWSFGIYAGGQSILVGTPSGVTLAPEGGAHQSVITPSIGLEQPHCTAWEPAFAQDLEWAMLDALSHLGSPEGTSAYFRLSTRPIDQSLADLPTDAEGRARRRQGVLSGGYRLHEAEQSPMICLVGMGAVMPEVLAAALALEADGVRCDVVCLTSADLVFRAVQARRGLGGSPLRAAGDALPDRTGGAHGHCARRAPPHAVFPGYGQLHAGYEPGRHRLRSGGRRRRPLPPLWHRRIDHYRSGVGPARRVRAKAKSVGHVMPLRVSTRTLAVTNRVLFVASPTSIKVRPNAHGIGLGLVLDFTEGSTGPRSLQLNNSDWPPG